MLHGLGYSPQVNKKTLEDAKQIDRDDQFNNLNIYCSRAITAGSISWG